MKRLLPLLLILLLMLMAYLFELQEYFTLEQLQSHRSRLIGFIESYPFWAPLLFILVYTISTALSLPGGAILSIAAGFLFPQPLCMLYVLIGATSGAVCIFLAAKSALKELLEDRAGPLLKKMQKGFQEDAACYLLFLRLVPLFPFWAVNIAPAFFSVPLKTFIWTTAIGIIPGVFVFTQAGVGLGSIIDTKGHLSVDSIFTTDVKIALIALGIFALLPVIIKKNRQKRAP